MPYSSLAQERFFNVNRNRLERQGVNVGEWNRASKGMKLPKRIKKKKVSIKVDNHMRSFGEEEGGKIKINLHKHKGDKQELADTVYHESYHAKHPKATEKVTYKVTRRAMKNMPLSEKEKLAAKVKANHYKSGDLKRKFKMGRVHHKAGDFIMRMNESKSSIKTNSKPSLRKIAVDGLI